MFFFFIFLMQENVSSKSIAGLAGGIVMRAGYFLPWENSLHSEATTGFPAKWHLRDERRNAILMTCHYTDLGSASDWSGKFASASQKHYPNCARFSDVISRETSGGVAKCWLFPWRRGFQLDLLPNFSNFSRPRRQKQHQTSAYPAS